MGRCIKYKTKLLMIILCILVILEYMTVYNVYGYEIIRGHATAYTAKEGAITSTGSKVIEGGCAGSKDYAGKYIVLFKRLPEDKVGDLIGVYYCNDTGGSQGIKNGEVIDVFKSNLEECQEFMNLVYEDNCKGHVWIIVGEKEELFLK